ncbi:MAG: SIS domain-containing protein [Methylococcaceae bacterium]|nr:SIS domain-containing protein [Methylococcaceae bacterium]MDD1610235.1 SIS domain-containing protein [Methylococcaceae bacterium]MDD1616266.1 SIS domain-containing protein [Methylococcaceae bacterium]OYV18096.1 MAG: D-sedoheptulose 7-phosphate isomerase [Methylococcaceae bacterium NSP1-2]
MSLQDRIINHFTDHIQIHQESMNALCEVIEYAAQGIVSVLLADKKILCCGNGRSATCVQLFSSSMLNQFERDRPALPVIALTADTATITAIATDYSFSDVYAKQLRALGDSGDILLIYTDGDVNASLTKAISTAHEKGLMVIALSGRKGIALSMLLKETDINICVPSTSTARIQEVHVSITHCLCDLIDHQLFGG